LYEPFLKDYGEHVEIRKENPFFARPSILPVEHYLDSYVGRQAVDYIAGYHDQRPMCLFVGFPAPHNPWDAPGEYATMYEESETPEPIPWPGERNDLPEEIAGMEDFQPMLASTPDNIRKLRANYYGKLSLVDHWIGRILETCEEKDMIDDTIIVFWSDHGEMLGDHRRIWKSTFHESSLRVPLILRWPGRFAENETSDALAEIIDVYPTLIEALGMGSRDACLGRSLVPLLEGQDSPFRESQLSEIIYGGDRRVCLRTEEHKYAVRQNGDGYMLFDLGSDPHEQHNMAGQETDLEQELRDKLLRRMMDAQVSM
jgi:arylsulfatase A-like enzyme